MKKIFLLGIFIIALAGMITAGVTPPPTLCEGNYENHGEYVSCVAHATQGFVEHGLIVSEAARSDIGKK